MQRTEILHTTQAAFEKVLGHANFTLDESTTAEDVDGWDSITHMLLINEVESRLNLKFTLMELMDLKNIGELMDCIQAKQ